MKAGINGREWISSIAKEWPKSAHRLYAVIRGGQASWKSLFDSENIDAWFDVYVLYLSSKHEYVDHVTMSFWKPFIRRYLKKEQHEKLFENLEKWLLRCPELSTKPFSSFVLNTPFPLILDKNLSKSLISSLLSNFKSKDTAVREASSSLLYNILVKSTISSDSWILKEIIEKSIGASFSSSVDARASIMSSLGGLFKVNFTDGGKDFWSPLSLITSKENNESVLVSFFKALSDLSFRNVSFSDFAISTIFTPSLTQNTNEKLRRAALGGFFRLICSLPSYSELSKLISQNNLEKIHGFLQKWFSNSLVKSTSVNIEYIQVIALLVVLDKADGPFTLDFASGKYLICQEKVYAKLGTRDEVQSLLLALSSVIRFSPQKISSSTESFRIMSRITLNLIFRCKGMVASRNMLPPLDRLIKRNEGCNELTLILVEELINILDDLNLLNYEDSFVTGVAGKPALMHSEIAYYLGSISKILISSDADNAKDFIFSIPLICGWPSGTFVDFKIEQSIYSKITKLDDEIVDRAFKFVLEKFLLNKSPRIFKVGKLTLEFMIQKLNLGDKIISLVMQDFDKLCDMSFFQNLSENDLGIFRHHFPSFNETEPFVAVVKKKDQNDVVSSSRNSKNYKDELWEKQVKLEIAQKKGIKLIPSYTKEEMSLIKAQLASEREFMKSANDRIESTKNALAILDITARCCESFPEYLPDIWNDLYTLWGCQIDDQISLLAKRVCLNSYSSIEFMDYESPKCLCVRSIVCHLNALGMPVPPEFDFKISGRKEYLSDILSSLKNAVDLDFESFQLIVNILVIPVIQRRPEFKDPIFTEPAISLVSKNIALISLPGFPIVPLLSGLISVMKKERKFEKKCVKLLDEICENLAGVYAGEESESISPSDLFNEDLDYVVLEVSKGLLGHLASIRIPCLKSLSHFSDLLSNSRGTCVRTSTYERLVTLVLTLCQSEEDGAVASELWESAALNLPMGSYFKLLLDMIGDESCYPIREYSVLALRFGLESRPNEEELRNILHALYDKFQGYKPEIPDSKVTVVRKVQFIDSGFEVRKSLGDFICLSSEVIASISFASNSTIMELFKFIVTEGLCDSNHLVQKAFNSAALALINFESIGDSFFGDLLGYFESILELRISDDVDEFLIVFIGSLAKYLGPKSKQSDRNQVLQRVNYLLLETFSVPSETVQVAVCECLANLVQDHSWDIVQVGTYFKFFRSLLECDFAGEGIKRGAAFGITALVKGRGIQLIKELEILKLLNDWFTCSPKTIVIKDEMLVPSEDDWKLMIKHAGEAVAKVPLFKDLLNKERRGSSNNTAICTALKKSALYLVESFVLVIPRLFEPYVRPTMPHLLAQLNELSTRETALYTSKVVVRNLSQPALTLIIPSLISILEDNRAAWRAKKAAVQMLSQLSEIKRPLVLGKISRILLPRFVRVVLEETVADVKNEAKTALSMFANGITASVMVDSTAQSGIVPDEFGINNPSSSDKSNKFVSSLVNSVIDALSSSVSKAGQVDKTNATLTLISNTLKSSLHHDGEDEEAIAKNIQLFQNTSLLALVFPILRKAIASGSREVKQSSLSVLVNLTEINGSTGDFVISGSSNASFFLGQFKSDLYALVYELLFDPVPETRSMAAHCFGMLKECFSDCGDLLWSESENILSLFMNKLNTEGTVVGRNGLSQAVCEMISGISSSESAESLAGLEAIMNDIFNRTALVKSGSRDAHQIRENNFYLFLYLPIALGPVKMDPYMNRLLSLVFKTVADEPIESIRDLGVQALMTLTRHFTEYFVEKQVFNRFIWRNAISESSRMRFAIVKIISELVFRMGYNTKESLNDFIGQDNFSNLLAVILLLKHDRFHGSSRMENSNNNTSGPEHSGSSNENSTKSIALNIWKTLVSTPVKAIKEVMWKVCRILVEIFGANAKNNSVLENINLTNADQANEEANGSDVEDDDHDADYHETLEIAKNTLIEIVHKLGISNVIENLVPHLLSNFKSLSSIDQEGCCILLHRVLVVFNDLQQQQLQNFVSQKDESSAQSPKEPPTGVIQEFENDILDLVKMALPCVGSSASLILRDLANSGLPDAYFSTLSYFFKAESNLVSLEDRARAIREIVTVNCSIGWKWLTNNGIFTFSAQNSSLIVEIIPILCDDAIDLSVIEIFDYVSLNYQDGSSESVKEIFSLVLSALASRLARHAYFNLGLLPNQSGRASSSYIPFVSLHDRIGNWCKSQDKKNLWIPCQFIGKFFNTLCNGVTVAEANINYLEALRNSAAFNDDQSVDYEDDEEDEKVDIWVVGGILSKYSEIIFENFMHHAIASECSPSLSDACLFALQEIVKGAGTAKMKLLLPALESVFVVEKFKSDENVLGGSSALSSKSLTPIVAVLLNSILHCSGSDAEAERAKSLYLLNNFVRIISVLKLESLFTPFATQIFGALIRVSGSMKLKVFTVKDEDLQSDEDDYYEEDEEDEGEEDALNSERVKDLLMNPTNIIKEDGWCQLVSVLLKMISILPQNAKPFCPQLQRIFFKLLVNQIPEFYKASLLDESTELKLEPVTSISVAYLTRLSSCAIVSLYSIMPENRRDVVLQELKKSLSAIIASFDEEIVAFNNLRLALLLPVAVAFVRCNAEACSELLSLLTQSLPRFEDDFVSLGKLMITSPGLSMDSSLSSLKKAFGTFILNGNSAEFNNNEFSVVSPVLTRANSNASVDNNNNWVQSDAGSLCSKVVSGYYKALVSNPSEAKKKVMEQVESQYWLGFWYSTMSSQI